MLTDYHVHLRPDEPRYAARELLHDGERRALSRGRRRRGGIAELGVSEHIHRFRQALDDLAAPVLGRAGDGRPRRLLRVPRRQPLRVGIEVDFVPGAEDRIAALLGARDFDYVVGSVHFVGDRCGRPRPLRRLEDRGARSRSRLGALLRAGRRASATSGLFDVIAHPDLVKVWGTDRPRPEGDLRRFYEPAVEAIAESRGGGRGLDRGPAQAGGRALPVAGFAEMLRRGWGAVLALLRRPRARADRASPTTRRVAFMRGLRDRRGQHVSRGASGRWSLWDERSRSASATTATASPPGRPLVLGGSRSPTSGASTATPTPTCSPTRSSTRCSAPPALGDIGTHFPPDDERWRDADSIDLLRTVLGDDSRPGVNVDATVICEEPRLGAAPRRAWSAASARRSARRSSVKATTNEGMGCDRPRRGHRRDGRALCRTGSPEQHPE